MITDRSIEWCATGFGRRDFTNCGLTSSFDGLETFLGL